MVVHADSDVHVGVTQAESVLRLVSRPVQTNARVGLLHAIVEEGGGVCAVPRSRAERIVRERSREGRRDGRRCVEHALRHLVTLTCGGGADDAVHRVHEIRQIVDWLLYFLVPHFSMLPVSQLRVRSGHLLWLAPVFLQRNAEHAWSDLSDVLGLTILAEH